MDLAKYDACYNSDDALKKVQDDAAEATQRGITGTPSFVINNNTLGPDVGNIEAWRKTLDDVYQQVTASPTAGASATGSATAGASTTPSASATKPAATTPTAGVTPTTAASATSTQ
jgi:hypothetical protein